MHLVNLTTDGFRRIFLLSFSLIIYTAATAQENSPYSRYGLGDLVPSQNIVNRGMGGFSAAYSDYGIVGAPFNLNFTNPASLGNLTNTKNFSNTIFDFGGEVDIRSLKSTNSTEKYKSANAVISYIQIGFPVSTKKMEKKGTSWGLSFGLRPISRINYKIEQNNRITNIDSANTLYEGTGGVNQVNISTGIRKIGKGAMKNEFSIGISTGYTFGTKDFSTRLSLLNDSVSYYKSNSQVQSRFGGVFINTGIQYKINTGNAGTLRLGAYANIQQSLSAKQNTINETFGYDGTGGVVTIDSVSATNDVEGTVKLPSTFGAGFTYHTKNKQWLLGTDMEFSNWSSYRYYNEKDLVNNSWIIRAGAEYYPAKYNAANNKYFSYVKYRAGFYFGPDYIKLVKARNNYAATIGASFPLTTPRTIQSRGDYVVLNTSIEAGGRGNKQSAGLRENFVRVSFGISMNARWFQKRSYD